MQVGRSGDPAHDARALAAIADACGPAISLRADANRLYTLPQALAFAAELHRAGVVLEYIEEPVSDPVATLDSFVAEAGIPVALDESIDEGLVACTALQRGAQRHSASGAPVAQVSLAGVVAFVIKPSVIGSLGSTCELLRWAAAREIRCVVSSAFESSAGICKLAAVAAFADAIAAPRLTLDSMSNGAGVAALNEENIRSSNGAAAGSQIQPAAQPTLGRTGGCAHGLGTLSWFRNDPAGSIMPQLAIHRHPRDYSSTSSSNGASSSGSGGSISQAAFSLADVADTERKLSQHARAAADDTPAQPWHRQVLRVCDSGSNASSRGGGHPPCAYEVSVLRQGHAAASSNGASGAHNAGAPPVLLLHGFCGSARDWQPVMAGLAAQGLECAAIDLPGHGRTQLEHAAVASGIGKRETHVSLARMRTVVAECIDALGWRGRGCTVVGYSLGARIALELAAPPRGGQSPLPDGMLGRVVCVSGSPGIVGPAMARARERRDEQTADAMQHMPARAFVEWWYHAPMWASLRKHPRFAQLATHRVAECEESGLARYADVLVGCSSGRQNLWHAVTAQRCVCQVSFVVGELDSKFVAIAQRISRPGAVGAWDGGVRRWDCSRPFDVTEVAATGHAIHVEQPLALLSLLSKHVRASALGNIDGR